MGLEPAPPWTGPSQDQHKENHDHFNLQMARNQVQVLLQLARKLEKIECLLNLLTTKKDI